MASDQRLDTIRDKEKDPLRIEARSMFDEIEEREPPHLLLADEFDLAPDLALEIWKFAAAKLAGDADEEIRKVGILVRQVVTDIAHAKNPTMVAQCHRIAFDFRTSNHESMRSVARDLGVTVAAVSKRVRKLQQQYGLESVGTFNKSPKACAVLAQTNGRSRWGTSKDSRRRGAHSPAWLVRNYADKALRSLRNYAKEHHGGRFRYEEIVAEDRPAHWLDACFLKSKLQTWDEFEPVIRDLVEGDEPESMHLDGE